MAIIQPLLEYCTIVWDLHQMYLHPWGGSYEEVVARAEISPQQTHRMLRTYDMLSFKVLHKLLYMPEDTFIVHTSCRSHRLNHLLALTPYSLNYKWILTFSYS